MIALRLCERFGKAASASASCTSQWRSIPATREKSVSFRQLRKKDLSPIRYKKMADADAQEVPASEIVKGYEYERGRYVVLSDEDFETVRIGSTHSVDITDFVDFADVDPKFFYKT